MSRHDLKTILGQLQMFNIPGFDNLLKDLKDPGLAVHSKGKLKSIGHNVEVLKGRLEAMRSVFRVKPDEVGEYMANSNHFSEQEWKVLAKVKRDLGAYWEHLSGGTSGAIADSAGEKAAEKPRGEKPKRSPRSKGQRGNWIAS